MCLLTPIAGQVESVQEPFGASLNFQYDAYGDRTLVTDSFSGQLTTNYNANSLATATTFTGGGITMEVDQSYNGSGQVTSQTMLYGGSAVVTGSWSYTPAGAVQSVAYQNSGASWNDTLSNAYNADGQVTSQADDLTISGSGSTTTTDDYGYDESGQLTGENSATYNYDVNGNPTDVAGNTGNAATVGANNEMVSDTNWDYTYDNAGNLTQKTGVGANSGTIWTYGYDNANDLVSVCEYNDNTISSGHLELQVNYTYDVFGNRISQAVWTGTAGSTVSQVVTNYAFDGWNPAKAGAAGTSNFDVWAEMDNSGDLLVRYINGDMINQVFARVSTSEGTAWLLQDAQESVVDVASTSGALQQHLHYDAFGNMTATAEGIGGSLPVGSVTWTGQRFDVAISMYNMRGREYDPSMQQYLQQDPTAFGGGDANLRRIVGNSPANATDPSGLVPVSYTPGANGNPPTVTSVLSGDEIGYLYGGRVWRNTSPEGLAPDWRSAPLSAVKGAWPVDPFAPTWNLWFAAQDGGFSGQGSRITTPPWQIPPVIEQDGPDSGNHQRIETPQNQRQALNSWLSGNTPGAPPQSTPTPPSGSPGSPEGGSTGDPQSGPPDDPQSGPPDTPPPPPYNNPDNGGWTQFVLSWNSYLGDINSGWFAETGNVAAGISDTVTMNLTHRIRQAGGFDNVNYNSGFYTAGQVIGTGINIGLGFGNPCALGSLGSFGLKFINGIQAVGGLVNAGENLSQGNFIAAGFDLLGVAGNVSQLGQSCFTGETKLMARSAWREGWRRIDEIKVGDEVLSRHEDEPEGPLAWKRVEEVFERYGFVVDFYVGEQVIRTTTEHPFYVRGKGWVGARGAGAWRYAAKR